MDDNTVQDLKQFIATEVVVRLDKIDERIDGVERKIDKLSQSVANSIDDSNEASDSQLKEHEQRITVLEHKAV